jgi:cytochrome P450 family 4
MVDVHSTGHKWHTHRKMITPTFHFNILQKFVEVFSEKSQVLVNKLQKEVGSQSFNIYPYITKCALDVVGGKTVKTTCIPLLKQYSAGGEV